MSSSQDLEIIHQGVKFYWRTRNTIDITVVEHAQQNAIEVIAYEPAFDYEAPRIYLDAKILLSKIDHDEIESKLSFAKRNNVPITAKMLATLTMKGKSDYILNRLSISEFEPVAKTMKVEISFNSGDRGDCINIDTIMVVQKPAELVEFRTARYRPLM